MILGELQRGPLRTAALADVLDLDLGYVARTLLGLQGLGLIDCSKVKDLAGKGAGCVWYLTSAGRAWEGGYVPSARTWGT